MQEGNINKLGSFFLEREAGSCSWASQCRWGKGRVMALEMEEAIGPVLGWAEKQEGTPKAQGRAGPVTEPCRAKPAPHSLI